MHYILNKSALLKPLLEMQFLVVCLYIKRYYNCCWLPLFQRILDIDFTSGPKGGGGTRPLPPPHPKSRRAKISKFLRVPHLASLLSTFSLQVKKRIKLRQNATITVLIFTFLGFLLE